MWDGGGGGGGGGDIHELNKHTMAYTLLHTKTHSHTLNTELLEHILRVDNIHILYYNAFRCGDVERRYKSPTHPLTGAQAGNIICCLQVSLAIPNKFWAVL